MVRLDSPKRKRFSLVDFNQFPVWVWDEDGVWHQPITEADPSPDDYGTLFIRSRFFTNDRVFDGYLIGGSRFYAMAIFANGTDFHFNRNLVALSQKSLSQLFSALDCTPFQFFPVRYESPVCFKGGKVITGEFDL
jgi:hypothetical protein